MARTRSKSAVEVAEQDGSVTKTVKTVETKAPKRKAATDGPAPKKQKKKTTTVTVETTEEEPEKVKAPRIPTKASAQRIPKELDPSREDGQGRDDDEEEEEEEEDAGVLTIVEKIDPEAEDAVVEGEGAFQPGQDVGKIPKPKKSKKSLVPGTKEETGVIYIGRIPHGFYEQEIRQYLSQFGPVRNVRVSRNKKTGASKHFAFVEFEEASTAETVVKTMDNYLLFRHILKCRMVPKEQIHEDLFKGANRRFKAVPWNQMKGKELEKPRTEEGWQKKVQREQTKRAKKAASLKAMGYEFEAPALKEVPTPAPAPAETVVEEVVAEVIEAPEDVKAIEPAPVVVEEEEVVVETKPAKGAKKAAKAGKSRKAKA